MVFGAAALTPYLQTLVSEVDTTVNIGPSKYRRVYPL